MSPCARDATYMQLLTLASYLTEVEKRLHGLENVVSQLLPGVNIDDVLATPDLLKPALPVVEPAASIASMPEVALSPQGSTSSTSNEPILPEAVPNTVDGFNWTEQVNGDVALDSLTDGMAALSVEPTGVGYLGLWTIRI